MLCCMLIYLKTVTVVTDAVRISLIILITHVYAAVIYKRFELMFSMTLHKSVGFSSWTLAK